MPDTVGPPPYLHSKDKELGTRARGGCLALAGLPVCTIVVVGALTWLQADVHRDRAAPLDPTGRWTRARVREAALVAGSAHTRLVVGEGVGAELDTVNVVPCVTGNVVDALVVGQASADGDALWCGGSGP